MAGALQPAWTTYNSANPPALEGVNRGVGFLSTGQIITVESTGGNAISIHRFDPTTRVTTLITNAIPNQAGADYCSLCVDAADNIHLVYKSSATELRWVRLNKGAGLAWTVGGSEIVRSVAGTTRIGRTDVEVLDGGAVLVSWNEVNEANAAQKIPNHIMRVRHTGGAWATAAGAAQAQTAGSVLVGGMCSVARDLAGATANVQKVAYAYYLKAGNGTVPTFGVASINIATGAVNRTDKLGFGTGNMRMYGQVFSSANGEWTFVGMNNHAGGTNLCTTEYFRYNDTSGTFPERANPLAQLDGTFPTLESTYPTFALIGDTAVIINNFVWGGDASMLVRAYHPGVGWSPQFVWQTGTTHNGFGTGIGVEYLRAGGNRNRPVDRLDVAAINSVQWDGGAQDRHHFLYFNPAPAAPTTLAPGLLPNPPAVPRSVASDRPTLTSLTSKLPRGNERRRLRWQIDATAAFSGAQRTVEQPRSSLQYAGAAHYMQVDAPNELTQGTWHMRGAAIDEFGRVGPYFGIGTFVVSHPPVPSNQTPSGGTTLAFGDGDVTVSWTFQDASPYDLQTAYQVVLMGNDDGSIVADSGKIVSVEGEHTFEGLSATLKDLELRWAVRVWDTDDVASAAIDQAMQHVFKMGDAPVVTITAPVAGSEVGDPTAAVTWNAAFSGGRTQKEYRVTLIEAGLTLWTSGWVVGTETTVALPQGALVSGHSYSVTVDVRDTDNIEGTDTNTFTTLWNAPVAPVFTVDVSHFEADGFVRVEWTDAQEDDDFVAYRLYARRVAPVGLESTEWVLLYETNISQPFYTRDEFMVGASEPWEYRVVQVADRFGSNVESQTAAQIHTADGSYYWLIADGEGFRLHNVINDSPTNVTERELLPVIGRGYVEDRGDRMGWAGSLTCQIRDRPEGLTARLQRQYIMEMIRLGRRLYIRNPFGDLWLVSIGDEQIDRLAGVGVREFVDMVLPYTELEGAVPS